MVDIHEGNVLYPNKICMLPMKRTVLPEVIGTVSYLSKIFYLATKRVSHPSNSGFNMKQETYPFSVPAHA